jgi:hypothetical protein
MAGPAVRFEDGLAPAPLKGTNLVTFAGIAGVIFVGRVYRVKLPSGRPMPANVSRPRGGVAGDSGLAKYREIEADYKK